MAKPILLPEPFSGDAADWNEWLSHFESVAVVNKWETGGEKLKWLRVRLTGKAQTAFMKLPDAARDDYGECVKALKKRFVPDSRKDLYVAELQTRTKRREEDWASFGDSLRILSDRAYPDFEDKARERLALNQFLSQIDNPQVAFGVKQKRPGNIDEAVAATLELESYLKASGVGKSHQTNFVAQQQTTSSPRQEETAAMAGATICMVDDDLRSTLRVLSERLHRVEASLNSGDNDRPVVKSERRGGGKRRPVVCWNCGEKGHIARACRNRPTEHQGNASPSVARASHVRGDIFYRPQTILQLYIHYP